MSRFTIGFLLAVTAFTPFTPAADDLTEKDFRRASLYILETVQGRRYTLIVAINEATAEVKYFLANGQASLRRLLQVAFRRWTVEHCFRVAKQETGLMHFEGRHHAGLLRHLTLSLLVMAFVAIHTDRLRGEKPGGDAGAGLPGVARGLPDAVAEASPPLAA
ncbi:hypothetical protein BH11PLA2_BH11PLA2_47240 [soil metagenome]